jgi:hypothetical protein
MGPAFQKGGLTFEWALPSRRATPISTTPFPPFTHFFLSVSRAHNLSTSCGQSVFLKIRVHPEIPIVESSPVWCANGEADFRAAYSFDFTRLPPFDPEQFAPTIEIYHRCPTIPELIAVLVLPLRPRESIECAGSVLTFAYRSCAMPVTAIWKRKRIGTLLVSAAFGFPEHKQFLDPTRPVMPTPSFHPAVIPVQRISEVKPEVAIKTHQKVTARSIRRPRRGRRRRAEDNWVDEAINLGWRPPGTADFEWKKKAKAKGWVPPDGCRSSSIGVECDPNDRGFRQAKTVQTQCIETNESTDSEVVRIVNAQKSVSESSEFDFEQPHCVFEREFQASLPRRFNPIPNITLFSAEPVDVASGRSSSSSGIEDIHAHIEELKRLTAQTLNSFRLNKSGDYNSDSSSYD